MNICKVAGIIGLTVLPCIACAQDESPLGATLQAGTTGIGVGLSIPFIDNRLGVRVAYNAFSYDTDFDDTDVSYSADFNKDSVSLLLDWHPAGGGFRLTGGAYAHSDNSVEIIASPGVAGTYTINGNVYPADSIGPLVGELGFEKTTPYLGIGWGSTAGSPGLSFLVDLGVQFQDSPSVSLGVSNCALPAVICTQLDADIQSEIQELEADGEDFDLWPVANIGFVYRF